MASFESKADRSESISQKEKALRSPESGEKYQKKRQKLEEQMRKLEEAEKKDQEQEKAKEAEANLKQAGFSEELLNEMKEYPLEIDAGSKIIRLNVTSSTLKLTGMYPGQAEENIDNDGRGQVNLLDTIVESYAVEEDGSLVIKVINGYAQRGYFRFTPITREQREAEREAALNANLQEMGFNPEQVSYLKGLKGITLTKRGYPTLTFTSGEEIKVSLNGAPASTTLAFLVSGSSDYRREVMLNSNAKLEDMHEDAEGNIHITMSFRGDNSELVFRKP